MKKMSVLLLVLFSISTYASVDVNKKINDLKTSGFAGSALFGPRALGPANKIVFNTSFTPSFNHPHTQIGSCEVLGKSYLVDEGHGYGIMEIYEQDGGVVLFVGNYYHRPETMQILCPDLTKDSTVDDLQKSLGDLVIFQ